MGDIELLYNPFFGVPGSRKHAVAAGAAATIKAGRLVKKALGNASVVAFAASDATEPVVGTDYLVGLATSTSTETASVAGTVQIMPILPGMVFLGKANTATSWDTQAEYDALVGDRVLLDSAADRTQTILHTDGANNALVVEPLDIAKYPGKVAFSVRNGAMYFA
jgi:hypothetical protein